MNITSTYGGTTARHPALHPAARRLGDQKSLKLRHEDPQDLLGNWPWIAKIAMKSHRKSHRKMGKSWENP